MSARTRRMLTIQEQPENFHLTLIGNCVVLGGVGADVLPGDAQISQMVSIGVGGVGGRCRLLRVGARRRSR